MPDTLTISEVCSLTGHATSSLRFYEREGLIRPVGRRAGVRLYSPDILPRLAMIDMAKTAGFTMREIAELMDLETGWPRGGWQEAVRAKIGELTRRIAAAERAREMLVHALDCDAPDPATCPHFRERLHGHMAATQRPLADLR